MKITLSQKAGELREEARVRHAAFAEKMQAQLAGDVDEESRMSNDEIVAEKNAIQELVTKAAQAEEVDSLEGLLSQPADRLSNEAKTVLNDAAGTPAVPAAAPMTWKEGNAGLSQFLRAVRTKTGQYENPITITEAQKTALTVAFHGATALEQDRLSEKFLDPQNLKTLVGDDTGSTGRGDYLVPPEHMSELLRVMGESQQFVNRARRIPMARRSVDFPRLAQTSATDTRPMFSFAAISKIAEGAQKPEREPVFEQLVMTAVKYAAYVEASDELLLDSIVDLPPVLAGLLTDAIAYEYDRDCIRGTGVGEPQGFIGHASAYAQARAGAGLIGTTDIFNMEARFFGGAGIYMYHPSVIPQLFALNAANIIVWNPDLSTGAPGTLLGRPLVSSHKMPSLGSQGDLALVDPSFYLAGDLQRVTVANSIHYQFRNDVTAWRATFRGAGTPWPAGTFSHEADGVATLTYEVSPFVVLDA